LSSQSNKRAMYFERIVSKYREYGGDVFMKQSLLMRLPAECHLDLNQYNNAIDRYLQFLLVAHSDDPKSSLNKYVKRFPKLSKCKIQCGKLSALFLGALLTDRCGIFAASLSIDNLRGKVLSYHDLPVMSRKSILLASCEICNNFAHFIESWSGVPDEVLDQAFIDLEWNSADVPKYFPRSVVTSLSSQVDEHFGLAS
jgi:hypothetical protein